MIRALMPTNRNAAAKANDAFYKKHPEMVHNGKRTSINSKDKNYETLKEEWLSLYGQNGGKIIGTPQYIATKKVNKPVQSCVPDPCTIEKLTIKCSHKDRTSGSKGVLYIVAKPSLAKTSKYTLDPLGISITTKIEYGGEDKIISEMKCKGSNCKNEIQVDGPGLDSKWKSGTKRTDRIEEFPYDKDKTSTPLGSISPRDITVTARTRVGAIMVPVKQYPSNQYSYQVQVETLKKLGEKINKNWEDWGGHFFKWSPVKLKPKLDLPAGSLSGTYGWKEDEESCHAIYEVSAEAGLDPLIGIGISIQVSLVECGLAAVGVPPLISGALAEHLADILVGCGVEMATKLVGNILFQKYTSGVKKNSGKLLLGVDGSFFLEITARVGSDYIVSCSATGKAKITLATEWPIGIDQDGINFEPSIKLKPLTLDLTIKTKAFKVFSKEKGKSWKLWEKDTEIWAPKKQYLMKFS